MSDTDADKKRNKLGYQRISVACGHCRRRKIRCVMAEGDPQNRCQNCIRLQKQCVFYPVDQPLPPNDKIGPSQAASTPTIPSAPGHSPQEMAGAFDPRFPAVIPVPSNMPQGYTNIAYDASVRGQGTEFYRSAEYTGQWSQGDLIAHPPVPMASSFPQDNTTTYSPHTASDSMHSAPPDSRSYSFPGGEDSRQWAQLYAPPGRAMSYGNIENIQTTYAQTTIPAYVPNAQLGQQYLPQLDMQSAQLHQAPGPQSAPAGMQMPQYMTPTTPQGYPTQGAWYGGPQYEHFEGQGDRGEMRRTQR